MRWGAGLVLLLGVGLISGACSGGYPLPPTRCDEYCDATKGLLCQDYYEPAGCVSSCEQGDADNEACHAELDALIACFRKKPAALTARCDFSSGITTARPCDPEEYAFRTCVSGHSLFPNIDG